MKLKNRVALITGTSPNIGGGIAEGLAAEGAIVVAVDANAANAQDCAAYLEKTGGRALGLACDVTDEAKVKGTIDAALAAFGRIDVLVNNAVFYNKKGVIDMTFEEWNRQTAVILGGAFLFTKYACQAMINAKNGGSVINIASTAGHQGEPSNIAYSTAKCGLLNFTRSAAMELVGHGIRVNSLTPTATDPSQSFERAARWGRTVKKPEGIDRVMKPFRDGIPMGKLPLPTDYAQAAVFLASDDASMITGTDLRVDGGAIARYWAWEPKAGAKL
jgi:NAD(P)-dependent dehydrogenase (short-subunit alcohol dehydrogenase family)